MTNDAGGNDDNDKATRESMSSVHVLRTHNIQNELISICEVNERSTLMIRNQSS